MSSPAGALTAPFGGPGESPGRPWSTETPLLKVERTDDETARLVLGPVSSMLAQFGRFVLGQLFGPRVDRRRAVSHVAASLPNFLARADAYRDLRGDLLRWELPGHGLEPKKSDGSWYSRAHDDTDGRHVSHARHSCERSRCTFEDRARRRPFGRRRLRRKQRTLLGGKLGALEEDLICWRKWWARERDEAADRVSAASVATMRPEEPFKHIVISPRPVYLENGPPVWVHHRTTAGYRGLRTEVQRLARFLGLEGWLLIHHPFRVSVGRWSPAHGCIDGDHYHLIAHGNVRKTPAGGWREVCGYCGHASTAHDGGNGVCTDAGCRRRPRAGCVGLDNRFDGWFVKNLGPRRSVRGTIGYLLSHVGLSSRVLPPGPVSLPPGESSPVRSPTLSVVWGGDWSTRSFRPPEPLEKAIPVHFCVLCGRLVPEFEWFRVIHFGSGPPTHAPTVGTPFEWRAVAPGYRSSRTDSEFEEDLFARRQSRHADRRYWTGIRFAQWVRDNWGRDGWFGGDAT